MKTKFKTRLAARAWAVALCVTGTMSAFAQEASSPSPLTLQNAVQIAQARSQAARAQEAAQQVAQHKAIAAQPLPDPTLQWGVNNVPVNGEDAWTTTHDFMTMRSVGIMQEWVSADKRQALSSRFTHEAGAAQAQHEMTLLEVQLQTTQAWLQQWHQAQVQQRLQAQYQQAKAQLAHVQTAYRSGQAMQADVWTAQLALAQLDDQRAQNQQQRLVAQAQLTRWVGPLPAISQDLPAPDATIFAPTEWSLQDVHPWTQAHPHLKMLQKQVQMEQAELELAKAHQSPNWSVQLMYSQRGERYSDMVSVNFSRPLQWNARQVQDQAVAAQQARLEQALAEQEEATRAHLLDVQTRLDIWQSNAARLKRFQQTQTPLAQERAQAMLVAYRAGKATLASVIDAQRMALQTQIEELQLEFDTALSWAQFNVLIPNKASS